MLGRRVAARRFPVRPGVPAPPPSCRVAAPALHRLRPSRATTSRTCVKQRREARAHDAHQGVGTLWNPPVARVVATRLGPSRPRRVSSRRPRRPRRLRPGRRRASHGCHPPPRRPPRARQQQQPERRLRVRPRPRVRARVSPREGDDGDDASASSSAPSASSSASSASSRRPRFSRTPSFSELAARALGERHTKLSNLPDGVASAVDVALDARFSTAAPGGGAPRAPRDPRARFRTRRTSGGRRVEMLDRGRERPSRRPGEVHAASLSRTRAGRRASRAPRTRQTREASPDATERRVGAELAELRGRTGRETRASLRAAIEALAEAGGARRASIAFFDGVDDAPPRAAVARGSRRVKRTTAARAEGNRRRRCETLATRAGGSGTKMHTHRAAALVLAAPVDSRVVSSVVSESVAQRRRRGRSDSIGSVSSPERDGRVRRLRGGEPPVADETSTRVSSRDGRVPGRGSRRVARVSSEPDVARDRRVRARFAGSAVDFKHPRDG